MELFGAITLKIASNDLISITKFGSFLPNLCTFKSNLTMCPFKTLSILKTRFYRQIKYWFSCANY